MSAHEWTRARQRSVRREAQPITAIEPPALAPEPTSAVAEPPADDAALSPYATEPEPLVIEPAAPPVAVEPPPVALPEPRLPEPRRRPPRRRPPRPVARQPELPLGLEPAPEAGGPRSATETREELIERLLDPHLSLQETAKVLDVCPTTVRRYTNRGLLAHYRTPGNQRRFRLSDVLAFMERQGIPAQGLERQRAPILSTEGPDSTAG
jgi:excisionase family DNA binding protein